MGTSCFPRLQHRDHQEGQRARFHLLLLYFLSSVIFCSLEAAEASVNLEGVALLEFRSEITRDPSGIFSNWNAADGTPCNWTGVTCENDRVVKLKIQNAGLSGTISPGLSGLQFLRTLSLARNHLGGTIPTQLSLISSLWKLNLSSNALVGVIPNSIGRLPGLRMLDLSANSLTGIVPLQLFQNCPKLRYISLSDNVLLGTIPSSLGDCVNLVGIDLGSNGLLGSIPSALGRLSILKYLSLRHNLLSGAIPVQLGGCRMLELVDLSMNRLTGRVPSELGLLNNLKVLAIDLNELSGLFPAEVLYLPALESLNASRNMLSGFIPSRISSEGCHALQLLDLSSNDFEGPIPLDLEECQDLRFLNVSHNRLSSSIPDAIGELGLLHRLDFSSNQLSGVIPAEIQKLGQLSVLDLGKNRISGGIPAEIGELELLQVLHLDNMMLEGDIPHTLTECRFLLELNLSNNSLNGTIPRGLSNITYLRSLELERNKLHGFIPADIANLTHLQRLDLSFNNLTRFIPMQLGGLSSLAYFNVSYNNLTGMIPRNGIMQRFNKSSYIGNPFLCGYPLSLRCNPLVWPGPALSPAIFMHGPGKHVLSVSAILAIVAAAVIAVGVVIVTILNLRVLKPQKTELFVYESTPPSPDKSTTIVGKFVLFSTTIPSKYENWEEGRKALVDKDSVIGYGPLGTVYKAVVDGGLPVAVKKLGIHVQVKNQDEFEQEIAGLGNLKHMNLVTLEGYYWSAPTQLLLSEYIPNDSLYHHLHDRLEGALPLPWWRRFKIALGTARAVAYLHHDCRPQVLLFNLKSKNILLDYEYEPHVSDYGLSKLLPKLDTYISDRKFEQAVGYVAPEMAVQNPRLTDKCDVYSYGVVLLELVTGRRPVQNLDVDVVVLSEFARSAFEQGRGLSCIDPEMNNSYPESEIMQVLKLGLVCTAQEPSKRPTMAEVVQILEPLSTT